VDTANDALGGLIKLLGEIPNMVIGDDIQSTVVNAADMVERVHQDAAAGRTGRAFVESLGAVRDAEVAFYHPTILGYLYFPINEM
jgi:hypothetical protein